MPVEHSTFTVERTYPRPPEAVFAALSDPAKKRRWFAESDQHEVIDYQSDFRVGGAEKLRYRFTGDAPIKGLVIASDGRFEAILPGERVVSSSSMWLMDACISSALVTMELAAVEGGTKLTCTVQGAFFENSDGAELRRMGWEALLDALGRAIAP